MSSLWIWILLKAESAIDRTDNREKEGIEDLESEQVFPIEEKKSLEDEDDSSAATISRPLIRLSGKQNFQSTQNDSQMSS